MTARLRWLAATAAGGAMFVGVFLFYFLVYRVRHFSLPLGFDAPWYVWRADFVASQGVGPLDTASRPGHALLSADLHSLTGLSALELHVVLPFVLVAAFALALGVLFAEGLGSGESWRWAVGAGVAAGLIGTTRLVGENVANLLTVLLVAVAFLLLVRFVEGGRGFAGAVLMLVAAGLAHWLFLGVFGAILGVWFVLAWLRHRDEARALAGAGGITGAAMAALIYPVLHSSLSTFEIHEAKRRYLPKLREDLGALQVAFIGPAAALGVASIAADRRARSRGPFLRMAIAWAAVGLGGLAVAAATKVLPPHRFLTLLVVGPVALAVAAAVVLAARWVGDRARRGVAVAAGAFAVTMFALPAAFAWYGSHGPQQFFDEVAFQQAREANAYIEQLPADRPVVFVVSPLGPYGPISTAEKERTIRAALSPDRQEDVYVYPGDVHHALAGRFTATGNSEFDRENRTYWNDVRSILLEHPTLLALRQLGPKEFLDLASQSSSRPVASGVVALRGPARPTPLLSPLHPVPSTEAGVARGILLLVLLGLAGAGWALWFLGPGARPITAVALAPAVGSGMLMLASLVPAKAGLEVGGAAGVATFAVVTAAGVVLSVRSVRQRQRG